MRELAGAKRLTQTVIDAVRDGESAESVSARTGQSLDSVDRLMRSPLVVALARLGGTH